MASINEAYRVLSDPGRRAMYDRSLAPRSAPIAGDAAVDAADDDLANGSADRPTVLAPSGPARVPWRLMAAAAAFGSAVVLVSSFFDEPPTTEAPDGILRSGSCVAFEANGDAREVACTNDPATDIVVSVLVPLDATCPAGLVPHRDRMGLGIACVEP
jgi:molecular chaperone DnaJ